MGSYLMGCRIEVVGLRSYEQNALNRRLGLGKGQAAALCERVALIYMGALPWTAVDARSLSQTQAGGRLGAGAYGGRKFGGRRRSLFESTN